MQYKRNFVLKNRFHKYIFTHVQHMYRERWKITIFGSHLGIDKCGTKFMKGTRAMALHLQKKEINGCI